MRLFKPNVAKMSERKDIAGLVQALNDPEETVRSAAVQALVLLGAGPDLLDLACRSGAWTIWMAAAAQVARTGSARAVPPLAAGLAVDQPQVRAAARQALALMGPEDVHGVWIAALRLPYEEVLVAAVEELGKHVASDSAAVLVHVLEDRGGPSAVRVAAARALGRLPNAAVVEALLRALADPEVVPAVAAGVCAALGDRRDPRALPPLIEALASTDLETRNAAQAALVRLGPAAASALVAAVESDRDPTSELACGALASLGCPPAEGGAAALYHARREAWDRCLALGPELAVPALLRLLRAPHPRDREGAAAALARIGKSALQPLLALLAEDAAAEGSCLALGELQEQGAIEPLLALLADARRPESARAQAARALGRIAGERALSPLAEVLRDSTPALQEAACEALWEIGDPALPTLSATLRGPDNRLAELAMKRLDRMQWRPESSEDAAYYFARKRDWRRCSGLGPVAVPALLEVIRIGGASDREQAGTVLQTLGTPAFGALVESLVDPSWNVRGAVVRALASSGWRPATAEEEARLAIAQGDWTRCTKLGIEAVGPLVEALRIDGSCDDAAGALGRIADQLGDRRALAVAVEPLIGALSAPFQYESQRAVVIFTLGKLGDVRAAQSLLPLLAGGDNRVQIAAATVLGQIGDDQAVPALVRTAGSTDPGLADAATAAIAAIAARSRESGPFHALEQLLAEERCADRGGLAAALQPGGSEVVRWLEALLGRPSPRLRCRAAEILGALGDASAIDPLVAALDDAEVEVRESSALALGALRAESAVARLVDSLTGKGINEAAIRALATLGDARAIAPLLARLRARYAEVPLHDVEGQACVEALEQLGYRPDDDPNGALFWAMKARPLFLRLGSSTDYPERRTAATTLVDWYQRGRLDADLTARLLERREHLNAAHEESTSSNDCGSHTDEGGIGVAF